MFLFLAVLSLAIAPALLIIHRRKRCKSLKTVSKLSIIFIPFHNIELCIYEHNNFIIDLRSEVQTAEQAQNEVRNNYSI